jgi:hypothetical protein
VLRVCAWRQALGNNRSFLLAAPTPNASGCHVMLTSIDYMLKRWPAFTRFLDDGRICLSNNAAERALRGIALGRRAWLFAGSDRGGEWAAVMYTLIATAKLNGPIRKLGSPTRAAPRRRSSRLPAARPAPLSWKHRQTSAAAA